MRKSLLKWFTLIEMIITMIIVGILAVVLVEAYITVSKIFNEICNVIFKDYYIL